MATGLHAHRIHNDSVTLDLVVLSWPDILVEWMNRTLRRRAEIIFITDLWLLQRYM